jgi:hypothetical protein
MVTIFLSGQQEPEPVFSNFKEPRNRFQSNRSTFYTHYIGNKYIMSVCFIVFLCVLGWQVRKGLVLQIVNRKRFAVNSKAENFEDCLLSFGFRWGLH